MSRTRLVIVRHGSTKLNSGASGNSAECVRGWKDVPLSPKGIKEAEAVAKDLRNVKMVGLYSSNLDRAEHTAHIVSKATGTRILGSFQGLRPWHVGELAGKEVADCDEIMRRHVAETPDKPLPGGESFNDFKDRLLCCLDVLRQKHDGESIGLVTHNSCERLIAAWKAAGGGLDEEIDPKVFREDGVAPGDYVIRVIAEGDLDADDEAAPKRAAPSKPSLPWNSRPIVPNPNGAGKGLWSRSVGGPLDGTGLKADPFDLHPKAQIPKRSQGWAATVRRPLEEGR
jgi:broad specificity phosphatase PhoE